MKRLRLPAFGPFSTGTLIVMVAAFVALFANTAFFAGALAIYNTGVEALLFAGSLLLVIMAVFAATLSALCHGRAAKPVLIAFLLLSAPIAYFMNRYGVVVDDDMIVNVLETDMAEARDLFSFKLVLYVFLLGLLPSWFVYKAELAGRSRRAELLSRARLLSACAAVITVVFFSFSGHYISMFREHKEVWFRANPVYALVSAGKLARKSVKSGSLPHMIVGASARIPEADTHRELVIMVVGETARADHFSLNGYARETNPRLKKENVVNFPGVRSCGTSTGTSLPCMFSHYSRARFDAKKARAADNALDILQRAGVSVLWRENNSGSKHVADRVEYEIFRTAEKNPVCNVECRDEGMLHGLQDYIDRHAEGDILIVLHQMGNHGPAYYKRYPAAFERFTPVCKTNDLGACSAQEIVNAYDNAILYTDYFLSKVIGLLKRNDGEFETAMLYVSDHGESLGENGLYLHGLPWFIAPEVQKHVPFVMWFGRNFDHRSLANIEAKRNERLSHDNIFSTLLGLFEIRSAAYDPKMDILDHTRPEHW